MPPSGTLAPAAGSVEITVPRRAVSLNADDSSSLRPSRPATASASVWGSVVSSGALVKRPSVTYQPANAAAVVSMNTSNKINHPRRRRRASRSRWAVRRSAESCRSWACENPGGAASRTVGGEPGVVGERRSVNCAADAGATSWVISWSAESMEWAWSVRCGRG